MNASKMLISVLVVFCVLVFMENSSAKRKPLEPKITLTISATELKITGGPGHACNYSIHMGCVKVPGRETAEIEFTLLGTPNWKFTRMQLVPGANAGKFDFNPLNGRLSINERRDFSVEIDNQFIHPDSNGIIDLTGLAGNGRTFILYDENEVEQTYGYQIEACITDTNCKETDPKIENEGRR